MGELDVGNHVLVFTPEGQVEDEIVRRPRDSLSAPAQRKQLLISQLESD